MVAVPRGDGAARRYLGSGALLAVLDARGALGEGLAAAKAFGDAARAKGGALLVLVSRDTHLHQTSGLWPLATSRRGFLRRAAASGSYVRLPALSAKAADRRGSERPLSLITLWMQGGPSQLETWDPHPGTSIGGPTQAIDTSVPGLRIASLLPKMAELMHHPSVIRSLVSKEGDHERGSYHLLDRLPARIPPSCIPQPGRSRARTTDSK